MTITLFGQIHFSVYRGIEVKDNQRKAEREEQQKNNR